MSSPFAAIESAINAAVLGALSNAPATIAGTVVDGVFDAAYLDALGMTGNSPVFRCATADVASVAPGDAVVIGDTDYTVVGIEPDGVGMTLLRLQEE